MARAVPTPPEGERPVEERSVPGLVRQIVQESTELIRKEFQLLREELTLTIRETGILTGELLAGAVLVILAAGFLGFSLILLLSLVITPWISSALVGLGFLAIGLILIYVALNNFRRLKVAPRTTETLKEDVEWLRHPTRPEGK